MDDIKVLGDRYELTEPIGRGGMATIYRARDRRMGRQVAVKILREMYSNDPKFVLRFQREARAVSALAHPNIVQVFDYGQSDDNYFIVMELIEGIDLRRYLKRDGVLDLRRAVVIGHDVALALGAAHRQGIVHRDVKPQNILVNDDGLVKLTDFGIATFYRDVTSERLTTTGMTLGTVQYYAPEQAQGEVVTPAADVYALGIVLYEMLVGHPPFDGDTPVSIAVRHIQEAPIRPSRYNPAIPPTLERVIMRCLEKDPRDRYRDGDALAQALETFDKPRASQARMSAESPGSSPGMRSSPSRPLASSPQRRASGPRLNSSFDEESFIMPGPTVRDIAAGTRPGRSIGDFPQRPPDDDTPSPVAGITTAVIVAAVLLLLGVSCFLTSKLLGIGFFASSSPTATAGIPTVTVPNFVGMTSAAAQTQAGMDNINLKVTSVQSTAAQQGQVISQNPAQGSSVPQGGTVTVTVGAGPTTVTVPTETGKTLSDAEADLKTYGLAYAVSGTEVSSAFIPVNDVVSINPQEGTMVAPGTTITITVSSGLPTVLPTATVTPTSGPTATPTGSGSPTATPTKTGTPTATPTSTTPTP